MREIVSRLWLGSLDDVLDRDELRARGIGHVLTVMDAPLDESQRDGLECLFIKAYDIPNEDLIGHFEHAFAFIERGLAAGGVLVHCLAGLSRSATIVTAYIMKTLALDPAAALATVKQRAPHVCPNIGFTHQLTIFYNMNCSTAQKSAEYKQFLLVCARDGSDKYHSVTKLPINALKRAADDRWSNIEFKCRKCRVFLFDQSSLVHHSRVLGVREVNEQTRCIGEIFIEPVDWIDSSSATGGRIDCPKCSCKLGSYTWVGERCVCLSWVVPAFHISKQKVDMIRIKKDD